MDCLLDIVHTLDSRFDAARNTYANVSHCWGGAVLRTLFV